ncbi:hypothetical protein E2C01_062322 [Portunus trituberculatus]|uniref:Uncharacterized protein n=1 Tax=Portunus trituberculatus TaxID=210409 RepID=A0A5B7HFR8_PORTR|nr:hypothetical protein [Portunus trituberculatus]
MSPAAVLNYDEESGWRAGRGPSPSPESRPRCHSRDAPLTGLQSYFTVKVAHASPRLETHCKKLRDERGAARRFSAPGLDYLGAGWSGAAANWCERRPSATTRGCHHSH